MCPVRTQHENAGLERDLAPGLSYVHVKVLGDCRAPPIGITSVQGPAFVKVRSSENCTCWQEELLQAATRALRVENLAAADAEIYFYSARDACFGVLDAAGDMPDVSGDAGFYYVARKGAGWPETAHSPFLQQRARESGAAAAAAASGPAAVGAASALDIAAIAAAAAQAVLAISSSKQHLLQPGSLDSRSLAGAGRGAAGAADRLQKAEIVSEGPSHAASAADADSNSNVNGAIPAGENSAGAGPQIWMLPAAKSPELQLQNSPSAAAAPAAGAGAGAPSAAAGAGTAAPAKPGGEPERRRSFSRMHSRRDSLHPSAGTGGDTPGLETDRQPERRTSIDAIRRSVDFGRRVSVDLGRKSFEFATERVTKFWASPVQMHQDPRSKKHKHILNYDPGKALGWSSVFHLQWSDFKSGILIRTIILTGIAAALGAVSCRTDVSGAGGKWSFCLQQYTSGDLLAFSTLVSFLLTQFVAQTFSRWWSMRIHILACATARMRIQIHADAHLSI
eukprot:tig00021290_g19967.t1